jgi:hypothetical protein
VLRDAAHHHLRDADGLALIAGLELGELGEVLVDQVADAPDQLGPRGGGERRPLLGLERGARGGDRSVDVLAGRLGDGRERRSVRRVEGLEAAPVRCGLPGAADQQLLLIGLRRGRHQVSPSSWVSYVSVS